jgi:DNA-binding GntR family transcriptional regulator
VRVKSEQERQPVPPTQPPEPPQLAANAGAPAPAAIEPAPGTPRVSGAGATPGRQPPRRPRPAADRSAGAADARVELSVPAVQLGRSKHRTKAELAIEAIRQAIMEGRILPGTRLTLAQLSDVLEMSITPIREAIRVLEADGLVSYEAHKGVWVTNLTSEGSQELTLLRAHLEGLATTLAVPKIDESDLRELERLQDVMTAAAAARDDRAMTQANLDWHRRIYAAAKTQFVLRQIFRLWIPYGWANIWHEALLAAALRQHAEIYAAIVRRDAQQAGQLMHEHILWITDSRNLSSGAADGNGQPAPQLEVS